jgi:hypothetical protein
MEQPMNVKQTATELYNERFEDTVRLMDWIELELDKHQTQANASAQDWSNAGDLGNVRAKLIRTLAFLSNNESEDIENLLSECRQ